MSGGIHAGIVGADTGLSTCAQAMECPGSTWQRAPPEATDTSSSVRTGVRMPSDRKLASFLAGAARMGSAVTVANVASTTRRGRESSPRNREAGTSATYVR